MNLFVIGNGFDIAHGLPTRYSNFKEYLNHYKSQPIVIRTTEFHSYVLKDSISSDDLQRHELLEKLIRYIPESLLWSNMEEALGEIDIEQIIQDNSCYLKSYGADDWSDSMHHDYQYMIKDELGFTEEMKYWFYDWISQINTFVKKKRSVMNLLSGNDIFLNFNYTGTLEKTYEIPRDNILYIHGHVNNGEPLELGHNDKTNFSKEVDYSNMSDEERELYEEYMLDSDVRKRQADEIISDYYKATYKNTTYIINKHYVFWELLKNVNRVYILGHSLSDIDMDYFYMIKKKASNQCEWFISYYSEDDLNRISSVAKKIDIEHYNLVKI